VYNAILPFFILPILQLGHFLPVINNNCHPCLGLRMRQFKFMASWLLRVMLDFSTSLLICWSREYIIQHQFGEDHPSAYELAEGFAEILCFPQFQPCALMSISCMRILRENINVGFLPLINSVFLSLWFNFCLLGIDWGASWQQIEHPYNGISAAD
jgi:hypothetical protein